ncbi:MAG TPA: S8 family serine peptidase [Jiangellaceae bacterium]
MYGSRRPGGPARRRLRRLRVVAAGLVSMTLVAGMTATAQAAPMDDEAGSPASPAVEPQVLEDLADEGTAEFWVYLRDKAELGPAASIADRAEQGKFVYQQLTRTAKRSQAGLIAMLDAANADYEAFWVANAVRVTGDERLLARIKARPEVEQITADHVYEIPEPAPAEEQAQVDGVEWGVEQINAPQVWEEFGATGEGIVVGVIDSGAMYQHPALVNQYRGNLGGGEFDHNHNWHDPSNVCGEPSLAPCDNSGHGTHVTGTIVGDDGGVNRIGVAPGAQWIAAKGCESRTCSQGALLSAGQFMLAPTDLHGNNPRPDLRPHIINNSWGGGSTTDPWYQSLVDAWVAAGIFPQFANGNWSQGTAPCGTASNPGNLPASYAAGAFDIDGNIASFSNRGPSAWGGGLVKPNIAAPGVAVRSAWLGGGYEARSGTSMASPHVAGAVALMWSAAIAIERDVDATRALLDQTALDIEDLTCGGTAENNNVWGQGRLDAYAAVEAAPRGPVGRLDGTVTDAETGDPIGAATVTITGEAEREAITAPDGTFSVRLLAGTYQLTASAFAHEPETVDVTVAADETTTVDLALVPVPNITVSGTVTDGSDHGWPLYAEINVQDVPVNTYTDPVTGDYSLRLPTNEDYTLTFASEYPGYEEVSIELSAGVNDVTIDTTLAVGQCHAAPGYEYGADIAVVEGLSGDLVAQLEARGIPATQLGWEDDPSPYDVVIVNVAPGPTSSQPYLEFFDAADTAGVGMLFLDSWVNQTGIWQLRARTGIPSQRTNGFGFNIPYLYYQAVAEHPVLDGFEPGQEIVFDETSQRKEHAWFDGYTGEGRQVIGLAGRGDTGVMGPGIGVQQRENNRHVLLSMHASRPGNGMERWTDDGERIFFNALSWLAPDAAFECLPQDGGLVVGQVSDLNTGDGVNGATVANAADPEQSGTSFSPTGDPAQGDGFYWAFVSSGGRQLTATADRYVDVTEPASVAASAVTEVDFALPAGRLAVDTTDVVAEVDLGNQAERTVTITNTGTGPAEVALDERPESFDILSGGGLAVRSGGGEVQYVEGEFSFGAPTAGSAPSESSAPGEAPAEPGSSEPGSSEPGPSADPWTDLPNYPRSIMDNAAAVVDGTLYSFGGFNGANALADAYAFSPRGGQWTSIAKLPSPRIKPEAVAIDGLIYVVGGWAGGEFAITATTFIYDPATNTWSQGADMPEGRAAPGATVLDGQLYVVGGCTTSNCTPMASEVFRYDPGADEWETLPTYPVGASWLGCAGLAATVVCAGGTNGQNALSGTWAYDPDAEAWIERASMPYPNWAMAYAAASGQLVVSGGIVSGATATNRSAVYAPDADLWIEIEPSNVPAYRGAGACGFYRVGGSLFEFTPLAHAERHPDFDDCTGEADVPWLSADPLATTLEPGESVTVTMALDGAVDQPGSYRADVDIRHDTPYAVDEVGVTMDVAPPNNWAKVTGTVTGVDCAAAEKSLTGVTVQITGKRDSVVLWTGRDDTFTYWMAANNSPLELIVSANGYLPEYQKVQLRPRHETVVDVALRQIC